MCEPRATPTNYGVLEEFQLGPYSGDPPNVDDQIEIRGLPRALAFGTHRESAHLKVVGTSKDTTAVAKPRSTPEADTVWGVVALITTSLPPPGGSANKIADGIVSCPALEGAWQ